MMFYEHTQAYLAGEKVEYDIEPESLNMPNVQSKNGVKIYNR